LRSRPTTALGGPRTNETDSGSRGLHLELRRLPYCLLEGRAVPHSSASRRPLPPQWPRHRYSRSEPRAWRNADATSGRSPSAGQFAWCLSRRRTEPGEIATRVPFGFQIMPMSGAVKASSAAEIASRSPAREWRFMVSAATNRDCLQLRLSPDIPPFRPFGKGSFEDRSRPGEESR
jgi:hypothetical protein